MSSELDIGCGSVGHIDEKCIGLIPEGAADVRGFEGAGDDVGLVSPAVDEPAGFGSESGLVPGQVDVWQAGWFPAAGPPWV